MHQPLELIVPCTNLHTFGGSKLTQTAQLCFSFGWPGGLRNLLLRAGARNRRTGGRRRQTRARCS
jgi:hypothetical protein